MALNPQLAYPAQITTGDPGYPYGKAQNDIVEGDGVGSPLERQIYNDIFGFQQSLLVDAGITPSGTPDEVGASQYMAALEALARYWADDELGGEIDQNAADIATLETWQNARIPQSWGLGVPFVITANLSNRFNYLSVTAGTVIEQVSVGSVGSCKIPFQLPYPTMRIKANSFKCYAIGSSGHGSLPQFMPSANLNFLGLSGDAGSIAIATDTSATPAAYEVEHALNATHAAFDLSVLPNQMWRRWEVEFKGEGGSNSQVGLRLIAAILWLEDIP